MAVVPPRSYRDAHPDTAWLIVEVAQSSLAAKDRDLKSRLYTAFGVEEYWVVDLVHGAVRVHRSPREDGYEEATTRRRGETLQMARFSDIELSVDDIIGPSRS